MLYQFDNITVDTARFQVTKNGELLSLEPKAFSVLVLLLENRRRVVEKDELLKAIWKETFVTDNALTRVIAQLRKILGDHAHEARYIETIPTRGYRFIAEASERFDAPELDGYTAHGKSSESPLAPSTPPLGSYSPIEDPWGKGRFATWASMFGILLVAGFLIVFVLSRNASREPAPRSSNADTDLIQITNSAGLDIFPSFSPNADSIAYSSDRNGNFEIYVKPLVEGAREIQITSDGRQNLQPSWSPDGKWIAYHSRSLGGLWLVPALGGVARRLTDFGSNPVWSPDGEWIVFHSDDLSDLGLTAFGANAPSTLWLQPVKGGPARQLTQPGVPVGGHGSPSWSPDGHRVLFITQDQNYAKICSVKVATGALTEVLTRSRAAYCPVYSADGRHVWFTGYAKTNNFAIWKLPVSADTGEALGEPEVVRNTEPRLYKYLAVSRNGDKLAFSSLTMSDNLWSLPISPRSSEPTGLPTALTNDTNLRKAIPVFSPEGDRIAYIVSALGRRTDVWMIDSDGKNPRQVTTGERGGGAPSWLPDGDHLAIAVGKSGMDLTLSTISLSTGVVRPLTELKDILGTFRLSPDGQRIAYQRQQNGAMNVWVAPVNGGEPRQVSFDKESLGFPTWSPDSRFLSAELRRGGDSHLVVFPASGGKLEQLTTEPGQSWPYGWSPDGDKVAFAGMRNGYWNLYWVSRSSRNQKQLTQFRKPNIYVRFPTWSPRGDQIVFEHAETVGNIWLMDAR